ncbi:MAG: hypothetical protein QM692_25070 [Thermomicrobiales bacterium]
MSARPVPSPATPAPTALIAAPFPAPPATAWRLPRLARAALWAMLAVQLITGLWQQVLPRAFYDVFPGFGMEWVSPDGPYNEHLLRDVGGLNLALAFLIGLALARPTPTLARGVSVAVLIAQVPHFLYHAAHLDLLPTTLDRASQTGALALLIVLPVVALLALHDARH